MTRRKVKLAWIVNNTSRRACLKKRKLGLVKKVEELTTLCGIESRLLMYSPGEHEPIVWPSPDDVKQLIEKLFQSRETFQGKHNGFSEGDVLLQPPSQESAPIIDNETGSVSANIEDNKRKSIEPLSWDDWFHNIMNSNEFRGGASSSSVRGDMNLTHYGSYVMSKSLNVAPYLEFREQVSSRYPFGDGSSSDVAEQVPPRYPFSGSSSRTVEEQMSVDATDSRLPPLENFDTSIANADLAEDDYFDLFDGMGPGHYPLGLVTSNSPATELNPFEFHGGERNSNSSATTNSCAATSKSALNFMLIYS
ncbi:hypothetical protein F3Y22_tig00110332pilonHSYRG00346 [Hibiscus syriacus]|uniref:MADS-box domain-containing protein n=1 Tax=Hibiscus syriacus TaxID=106335 RepID=A0A6A3B0S1_HIBSY|nr:hypothetical protein F3Y22_tig00110332pilonHSYRG00346 [Hibiscus syriacus]